MLKPNNIFSGRLSTRLFSETNLVRFWQPFPFWKKNDGTPCFRTRCSLPYVRKKKMGLRFLRGLTTCWLDLTILGLTPYPRLDFGLSFTSSAANDTMFISQRKESTPQHITRALSVLRSTCLRFVAPPAAFGQPLTLKATLTLRKSRDGVLDARPRGWRRRRRRCHSRRLRRCAGFRGSRSCCCC